MDIVDLHAHVLPGVDDGPPTVADACRLLAALAAEGVVAVAATSHVVAWAPNDTRTLRTARRRVQHVATPEVVPGAELSPALLDAVLRDGPERYALGGGDALLVEADPHCPLDALADAAVRLRLRGLRLVVAHPERNHALRSTPWAAEALVDRGAMLQLTAAALVAETAGAGARFAQDSPYAWDLLERGQVHIVASDAHDLGARAPHLQAAARAIRLRFGGEAAALLLSANPRAVLAGRPLAPFEPRRAPALRAG
jgi:protein-tyrosine phosphatase